MVIAAISPRPRPQFTKVELRELARHELPLFLFLTAVVVCSLYLKPSPDLYGTHTQLGLPPCPMMAIFHVRCPGCGLTTSFSATAHGKFAMAFRAHPAGPFLWLGTVIGAIYYLVQLLSLRRCSLGLSLAMQNRIFLWVVMGTVGIGVGRYFVGL